jgi:hypothetical protein
MSNTDGRNAKTPTANQRSPALSPMERMNLPMYPKAWSTDALDGSTLIGRVITSADATTVARMQEEINVAII